MLVGREDVSQKSDASLIFISFKFFDFFFSFSILLRLFFNKRVY